MNDVQQLRDLADAMRRGTKMRPHQAFGYYYHDKDASCALGAAAEGAGLEITSPQLTAQMNARFPVLYRWVRCSETCQALLTFIVRLNDEHKLPREVIANVVEVLRLEADPNTNTTHTQEEQA